MKITIKHKDSELQIEHSDLKHTVDLIRVIEGVLVPFEKTFNTKER